MKERIDKFMVENNFVKTRSQSRMLIKQGDVLCNGIKVLKPGHLVNAEDKIEIKQRHLYVSRGAFKLLKAIEYFDLDMKDKVIADCGASTGGFTQIALINGARKVYAIDVGHDQLDELIKKNARVVNIEGVNLKHSFELEELVDICVVDLSFISITKVFPTIYSLLKSSGLAVVLIKPQFEAGRERLGKGAIVKKEYLADILEETRNWFKQNNYNIMDTCESPVTGKTGNIEYLALIKKS